MVGIKFIVVLKGYTRILGVPGSKRLCDLFISKVSFAKGDGYRVNKIWHTRERAKALSMGKLMAEGVAQDLNSPRWRKFASVESTEPPK